jgi:DNA-binding NarL/FixJ family response regulator
MLKLFNRRETGIRVLCVEDDEMTRQFLQSRLEMEPDVKVVGYVASAPAAVELLKTKPADIVILDEELASPVTGMQLLAYVTQGGHLASAIRPRVLFCTGAASLQFERRAMESGAAGVIAKECVARDLLPAIRSTMQGGFWFPLIEAARADSLRRRQEGGEASAPLPGSDAE